MKDLKRLLDLAFLPEDTVCPSNCKFAFHSMPISSLLSGEVTLVSPNQKIPNNTVKTEELNLLAINPIEGFRNDENVYRCQNFLWEIDLGPLGSQLKYVEDLKLPYSIAIYSGSKSIHFLTSLEEPIDEKRYRLLYQWGLNIGTLFDQSCKNPSRSIRIPGAIRPETGKTQQLVNIKGKVKLEDFIVWLETYPHVMPKDREKRKALTGEDDYVKLSPWAKKQFKEGIDFSKGRNRAFFGLACDLAQSGYDEETATIILLKYFVEERDFKEKELITTIASAFNFMINKG